MTKIIHDATEYIPLYNAEGQPLGIVDYNFDEKNQKKKSGRRRRSVSTSDDDSSSFDSSYDDEEDEDEEFSDLSSDEDDGMLLLLDQGTAPSNNAQTARFDFSDGKEQMYYSFFLLTVSRSFYNTFTPIIVSEGTHEKRELEIYLQAPTFEFANKIGFGPDVPMDMVLESISKIRRFLRSLDMRVSVGDPRFLDAILGCPSLDFLFIQPENLQDMAETENIIRLCSILMQQHPNIGCRGSAARTIAVKVCSSENLAGVHTLMVKYNVINIARSALMRDKYTHPETFRDYLACLESIITIENVRRSRSNSTVELENVTPLSEFTDAIDFIEDIFQNGDQRFLMLPEVMPFVLNFFVKIVSVPRFASEVTFVPFGMRGQAPVPSTPEQLRYRQDMYDNELVEQNGTVFRHGQQRQARSSRGPIQVFFLHPCQQRKVDFVNRYRDVLLPHLYNLIAGIRTLCDPLDADIITRVFIIIRELLSDKYWCDYYQHDSGRGVDNECWLRMIQAGRATLEHFPFDSVNAIFTRATNGEKVACCVFDSFAYVAASAIAYVRAHIFIDKEVAIRVPLLLSKGGPMIESFVKLLLIEKDPDGEPITWRQRHPIVHAIEKFYDEDRYSEALDAMDRRIRGITNQHEVSFQKLVADFFVKNSSVNQTLAKFLLREVPLLESCLFAGKFKKYGLKDLESKKTSSRLNEDGEFTSRLLHDEGAIGYLKNVAHIIDDTELTAGISSSSLINTSSSLSSKKKNKDKNKNTNNNNTNNNVNSLFNDNNPINITDTPKYSLALCKKYLDLLARQHSDAYHEFAMRDPDLSTDADSEQSSLSSNERYEETARAGDRRSRSGRAVTRVGRTRTAGRVPRSFRRR